MRPSRLLYPAVPAILGTLLVSAANPTCAGPSSGPRQFGEDAIVIPMDECWQPYTNVNTPGSGDVEPASGTGLGGACSSTYTMGTLYAYGFVYDLIANGVTVYWAIDPTKTSVTTPDVEVPGSTSQATLYNWSATSAHTAANGTALGVEAAGSATNQCTSQGICYRGGPFLIDGADFTTVYNLLQTSTFSAFKNNIQLHVMHPSSPFTANINRSLVGTPPTVALLAAPGVDCFKTAPILDQYLTDAHLPSSVYASLYAPDLNYTTGALSGSNLSKYSLLWIPHFYLDDGDGHYASPATSAITCNATTGYPSTQMTQAQATNVQSVIGQFVAGGGNLFAECAGISGLEGDDGYVPEDNYSSTSQFQTTSGIDGDFGAAGSLTYYHPESPFMQFGDFPFSAKTGYVGAWVPQDRYNSGVTSLVQTNKVYATYSDEENNHITTQTSDVLTWLSPAATTGNVVYLGGHSYTNYTDPDNNTTWQQNVAGERMVLNTLLTLSGNCSVPTADGGYCDTGLLGVCAAGTYACVNNSLVCQETTQPSAEVCDGLDNDCDGLIDDNVPPQSCYSGPAGTENCAGATLSTPGYPCACHAGSQFCINGTYGACTGEADPTAEVCNGIDDDCDGVIDNVAGSTNPLSQACYDGPPGTEGVGLCIGGTEVCTDGVYGPCAGEVTPVYGLCDGMDNDCNGIPDTCSVCTNGQTEPCYTGPSGSLGVGLCKAGTQSCVDGGWAPACNGQVLPVYDGGFCDGLDHACDNQPDLCSACTPGDTRPCYTGPSGTEGIGICVGGTQTCDTAGTWGSCLGEVLPVAPSCDGLDNTCDGIIDDGATCPNSEICVNGVCVPAICGGEIGGNCPLGYNCVSGSCALTTCGDGGTCAEGDSCAGDGGCISPCAGVSCGAGAICAGGVCVAGGCTSTGCGPDGGVCIQGNCVPNPCTGVACPDGTFCRSGYCVQACAFLTCPSGQTCDQDGQCVPTPCGGSCTQGQACVDGGCGTDPCSTVSCAQGQVCTNGICGDDPCATVQCPGQLACVDGQCVDQLRDGGGFGSSTTSSGTAGTTGHATSGTTGTGSSGTTGGHATTSTTATTGGTTTGTTASSGCGCATTSTDPLGAWPIVSLLGLLRFRRRRAVRLTRKSARSLSALAIALGLAACSTTAPAGSTSGTSGTSTVGLSNGSGTTGSTTSSSTTSGAAGCQICGSACVELASDPKNCGACAHACPTGDECLFGACGPTTPVAPILSSLSPSSGDFGTSLMVTLVGSGFTSTSQVLITGQGLPANDLQTTTFTDAEHLSFELSLLTITAGSIQVSAVNADNVSSNALTFSIVSPGSPVLTLVNPTTAPTGAPVSLTFTGTGLETNTEIHVVGGALPDQAIPTSNQTGASATATWDLTTVAPGNYSFYALTTGVPQSNSISFTVTSTGPALTSIAPTSGAANAQPTVTIAGSGFDSSSVILFGPSGSVTSSEATSYLSPTSLSGTLDLTNIAPGSYQVEVQNSGGLTSGPLAFSVYSTVAQISNVTPNTAVAGSQVSLQISGNGFDQTSVVHFQNSGSLDTALTTTYQSGTALGAALDLSSVTAGAYNLVVENAGVAASSAIGFTVTQNTPSVTGISPTSATQDSGSQTLTITGSDLQDGSTVTFQAVGGGSATFTLTLTVPSGNTSGTVTLNPASEPVGSYLVTITSPGNTTSNPGTFAIQPGTPVVDKMSPTSAGQTTATVVLCGQYFVSGLSSVHVSGLNTAEIVPGTFGGSSGCPNSTDSSITITTDLTNASPGVYQVTISNGEALVSNAESFTVNGP